jgi:hypothetical protein
MSESLPTRLLIQLCQASPKTLAAVERLLAKEHLADRQESLPPENQAVRPAAPEHIQPGEADRSFAAKVFQLLTALDSEHRFRKAPPVKVFDLYYRQGLPPAEIARRCKCHRSTIFERLAEIRADLPWSPQQLHEVSSLVEDMERDFAESGAANIYRKGAAYGDEDRARDSG